MKIFVLTKRTLLLIGGAILAVAAAVILLLCFGEGNAAPTAATAYEDYEVTALTTLAGKKVLPVYSVQREDKAIALTIDAAWEDDKTEYILAELAKRDVKVTFFLCGFWVEKYPDMVKKIADAGHEIGNHTATHPHMNKLSPEQMRKEMEDYEVMVEKLTGKRCTVFRPPYGEYNDSVVNTVREAGFECIQWDLDTVDWKEERSAKTILDSVIPKLHPGAIILCHNNGFKIKEYLPTLLDTAIEQGYTFVTVSELLIDGDTIIDVNGVQKPA